MCVTLTDREVRCINAKTRVAVVIPVGEGESPQRWFRAQLAQCVEQHPLRAILPHRDNATEGYGVLLAPVATNVNSEYIVLRMVLEGSPAIAKRWFNRTFALLRSSRLLTHNTSIRFAKEFTGYG